jgi:hypothetical protein
LAIVDGDLDEEGDLVKKQGVTPATPEPAVKEAVQKDEGLIVFFPGIPGSAKSALCKELLNAPGGFGDDRPVHTLMGDLVKGILECRFFLGQNCSGLSICYAISCNILHTGQENIGQRLLMNVVKNHNRLCWLTKMPQMKMSGDRLKICVGELGLLQFQSLLILKEPIQIHIHLMPWLYSCSVYFNELTIRYTVASYTQFNFNCIIQLSSQPYIFNKLSFLHVQ